MPIDSEKGGTWIATSQAGRVTVLLNGAFKRHNHLPPYRKSRGLVVLDTFEYANLETFFQQYDLDGIEPFTLVILESLSSSDLIDFRWDGEKKHLRHHSASVPAVWSSASLYSKDIIKHTEERFHEWLNSGIQDAETLLDFNRQEEYSLKIERRRQEAIPTLETLGISSIQINSSTIYFKYFDMISDNQNEVKLNTLSR